MHVNKARLSQKLSGIVSTTALVIGFGVLSASAETTSPMPVPGTSSTAASLLDSQITDTPDFAASQNSVTSLSTSSSKIPSGSISVSNSKLKTTQASLDSPSADASEFSLTSSNYFSTPANIPSLKTIAQNNTVPDTTAPGTTSPEAPSTAPSPSPAPVDNTTPAGNSSPDTTIVPGRATRSGSSYIGVGGNIGIGSGDTALGSGSFAILSKIGLTRSFSVRPSLLINDDVTILLPVTYDFRFGEGPTGGLGFSAAPYIGIGPAISTGDGVSADLLLTGGIDIPIGTRFTATAAVNATVTGNPAVGVLLGIGYNFAGF